MGNGSRRYVMVNRVFNEVVIVVIIDKYRVINIEWGVSFYIYRYRSILIGFFIYRFIKLKYKCYCMII